MIRRVMHGPGWADTLLIWTYDEHGGYYDHVAPPAAVPPDDVPGRSRVAHPCLLRSLLKVLGALDLTAPPAFLAPPELPAPALTWGTW